MKYFSSSFAYLDCLPELNPINDFAKELKSTLKSQIRRVYVAPMPDWHILMDESAHFMSEAIEILNVTFESYDVLESRTEDRAKTIVSNADRIILDESYAPTQNRFLERIGLRRIVACTMKCADIVYSPPELDREAVELKYQRFLQGLNLTKTMPVPPFDHVVTLTLDELDYLKDIHFHDSAEKVFLRRRRRWFSLYS